MYCVPLLIDCWKKTNLSTCSDFPHTHHPGLHNFSIIKAQLKSQYERNFMPKIFKLYRKHYLQACQEKHLWRNLFLHFYRFNQNNTWHLTPPNDCCLANPKFKGCGMGTLFVLVSPCFREKVVVTCKIASFFLCSLDNLLQQKVIVFFFGNQISKWCSLEKGLLLTYFSHSLVTREKLQKFLQHIFHSHIHTCILLTLLTFLPYHFFALPILKFIRYGFSLVWVLVLILIRAILEQSINNKMVSKI